MKIRTQSHRFVIAALLLTLAACGGGGDESPPVMPPAPQPPGTMIGAAGGTVTGPNGAKVVIPAGALATNTLINIEQTSVGAPALPTGYVTAGLMYAFTPHGTTFALPVTMTLPFDPALAPVGGVPAFYKTNAQSQWEQILNAAFDASSVSAQVSSFSSAAVLVPPLFGGNLLREWSFHEYRGDALERVELDHGAQENGVAHELYDFGGTFRDGAVFAPDGSSVPPDGIATGQIVSMADGKIFWAVTEAPTGNASIATDPIGSLTVLRHTQTFIKRASNATLTYTLSNAFLETSDANGVLNRVCPAAHTTGLLCDMITAELLFTVDAFTTPAGPIDTASVFYSVGGTATLRGIAGSWDSSASTFAGSTRPLWTVTDFDFSIEELDGHEEALIAMKLREPHAYAVDISSIAVGQAFTLQSVIEATAYNRAASVVSGQGAEFETSARAYLRDPLSIDGTTLAFTGLEPINTPVPVVVPVDVPVTPAPCVPGPGPNPAAGVIQFSAASYSLLESSTTPTITVTRTGGSVGAVTATFTTSDGTGIANLDYITVNSSVFFADGDAVSRVVAVPIIQDAIDEPDKTVNLTLSQPGGCAALGAQTSAVLTIRDDDVTPQTLFTVGGTVTGLTATSTSGRGLELIDHHGLSLIITADGPFTFTNIPSPTGTAYSVRTGIQPLAFGNVVAKRCAVTNGSGVIANANVTNIQVICTDP